MLGTDGQAMDVPTIITILQTGGLTAGLVIALWAFITNRVYSAKTYDAQVARAVKAEEELAVYRSITPRNSDNLQRIAELLRDAIINPAAGIKP